QFVSSIEMLIGLRLFLGAGVGLVMPLSMSLINDYFKGKERTQMMGYNSAFSNFGGIITMLLAGWLATFGWRTPFNVYFLGLFIFILIFFFYLKEKFKNLWNIVQKQKSLSPYGDMLWEWVDYCSFIIHLLLIWHCFWLKLTLALLN